MKRWMMIPAACVLLCACAQETQPEDDSSTEIPSAARTDSVYTETFRCTYELSYPNNTMQTFDLDGVLEVEEDEAHYTQNIYGNGASSALEGWYYGGRLYNTYNGVDYYEDMTLDQLKQAMQVQLEPYIPAKSEYSDVQITDGTVVYTLTQKAAEKIFLEHYDFYGFDQVKGVEILDGTITQTIEDGMIAAEAAEFHAALSQSGVDVAILYRSETRKLLFGSTEVTITDDLRDAQAAYVHYSEIDTDAISDADVEDDAPEETAEGTFRKRLVSRLGYRTEDGKVYKSEFNDSESYTIDFPNHQFIYTNYSSKYVYNWAGDVGVFGTSCTYELSDGTHSSDCAEEVLKMIEQVKLYLRMELYYCGLSLEDLQAESK